MNHVNQVKQANQVNLVLKSGEKGESGNQVNWVSPITAIKGIFSHQSHIRKVSAYSVTNIALRVNYGASVLQGEQYFTASLPHLSSGAATHPDASMIQPRWLHCY